MIVFDIQGNEKQAKKEAPAEKFWTWKLHWGLPG